MTDEKNRASLQDLDAYWRAANFLSVGQIFLWDNPLLKRPLTLADVKPMLLGKYKARCPDLQHHPLSNTPDDHYIRRLSLLQHLDQWPSVLAKCHRVGAFLGLVIQGRFALDARQPGRFVGDGKLQSPNV